VSVVIGIDPGLSGGIAALFSDGDAIACDLPVISDRSLSWIDGAKLQGMLLGWISNGVRATCVVERVSSMPGQGVASSFQFGVGFGSILSVVQTLRVPLELVTPAVWKRALGLSGDKSASLNKARLLFPSADLSLKKHDGRAEALLLAHWHMTRGPGAKA
jgi:crossover junction endodeoxyribonuclease RuvC